MPGYYQGQYDGIAARVGAELEAWELYRYIEVHMTVVVPGGSTVGTYGGWITGGEHSTLASTHGLGSGQALSLQVVTADGRFVATELGTNDDLFYALRGGGPGKSRESYLTRSKRRHRSFDGSRHLWYRNLRYRQGLLPYLRS
jgi:hypothetical protein